MKKLAISFIFLSPVFFFYSVVNAVVFDVSPTVPAIAVNSFRPYDQNTSTEFSCGSYTLPYNLTLDTLVFRIVGIGNGGGVAGNYVFALYDDSGVLLQSETQNVSSAGNLSVAFSPTLDLESGVYYMCLNKGTANADAQFQSWSNQSGDWNNNLNGKYTMAVAYTADASITISSIDDTTSQIQGSIVQFGGTPTQPSGGSGGSSTSSSATTTLATGTFDIFYLFFGVIIFIATMWFIVWFFKPRKT